MLVTSLLVVPPTSVIALPSAAAVLSPFLCLAILVVGHEPVAGLVNC